MKSAKQLVAELAACTVCGKEHKPRKSVVGSFVTYAASDGHAYRTRLFELTGSSSAQFLDLLRSLT